MGVLQPSGDGGFLPARRAATDRLEAWEEASGGSSATLQTPPRLFNAGPGVIRSAGPPTCRYGRPVSNSRGYSDLWIISVFPYLSAISPQCAGLN